MGEIRKPIKKTAIAKRNKIVEKGFELICNKGYHNVNIKDIALYADVSIGIIYQYFNDKKEIFLEGIKDYSENIMYPIIKELENDNINNINEIIEKLFDSFLKAHQTFKTYHEQVMSISYTDNEIGQILYNSEIKATKLISELIRKEYYNINNLEEKTHIIIGLIDNYCHEIIYHKHNDINYNIMKEELIKLIKYLLNIKEVNNDEI